MIPIQPFRALRPTAARAREFSVPRLDHLGEQARAAIEARLPRSLAAVIGQGGSELLAELEQSKALLRQAEPTFYMHRHVRGAQRCTGLVACLPGAAFAQGPVRGHRRACQSRRDDWRAHVRRLGAQVDPVIMAFEPTETILDLFEREMNERPLFHVVADDGATHTLWAGTRAPALQKAFEDVARAYLLEGHHRAAGAPPEEMVSVLLVPLSQMQPRWAVRVVSGEAGARGAAWALANGQPAHDPAAPPVGFADACLMVQGEARWMRFELPATGADGARDSTADARLDAWLARHAGHAGTRHAGEAQVDRVAALLVESGGAMAVVLPPPGIEEIVRVAESGERLPEASTWFEPRVRSGLWIA